jgi:hypothetical protein
LTGSCLCPNSTASGTGVRAGSFFPGAFFAFFTGVNNTAVGTTALLNSGGTIDTPNGGLGSNNTAVGYGALANATHGNGNTALGYSAGADVTTANNVIAIGSFGQDVSGSCFIGNIYSQHAADSRDRPRSGDDKQQRQTWPREYLFAPIQT